MNYFDIDIQDITIEDPIFNKNGSFESSLSIVSTKGTRELSFKMDKMKIHTVKKRSVILEFLVNHPRFFEFIYNLDLFILENIVEHGDRWFGKDKTPKYETLDRLFKKSIIPQSSITRYPTMEIPLKEQCKIYDINGDKLDLDELGPNNEVTCEVKIKRIIFLENMFFLDYCITNIQLHSYVCQQSECLFTESTTES